MSKFIRALTGFPGSVLLIPMFLSAVINTFIPGLVQMGEPVTSLLSGRGIMTLLFIMLFSSGMTLNIRNLRPVMKKAGFLMGGRLVLAVAMYLLYVRFFGQAGILGVSGLALLIVLCSTNPGIFVALMNSYGEEEDISLFGPLNILPLPAIPLVILSMGSGGESVLGSFTAMLLPFVIGSFAGSKWPDLKERFKSMTPIILAFWGFGVGGKINLLLMTGEVLSGLFLVVIFYGVMMVPLILLEKRFFLSEGLLTMSAASVAAVALVIPQLAIGINQAYAEMAAQAVNQLAFAVVVTSVVTPLLVQWVASGYQVKGMVKSEGMK